MDFIFGLLLLAFFGRGDADVCHSLLCLFVSGSYSKIHVSSPVITFFKKLNNVNRLYRFFKVSHPRCVG